MGLLACSSPQNLSLMALGPCKTARKIGQRQMSVTSQINRIVPLLLAHYRPYGEICRVPLLASICFKFPVLHNWNEGRDQ